VAKPRFHDYRLVLAEADAEIELMIRPPRTLTRRQMLRAATVGGAALGLSACDAVATSPALRNFLSSAEGLSEQTQRFVEGRGALAREYPPSDLSRTFRANGSQDASYLPPGYPALAAAGFSDWRLQVDGLVSAPATYALADLRALPARSQITRHDCVEGWSCIGQWRGPQLSTLLNRAGVQTAARYVVFHCADEFPRYINGDNLYYESIDLIDAFHPQTILAYEMNGAPLPLAHGAPLRLRVERQLGYKMAKFLSRIEVVATLNNFGKGRGGYWEDLGYQWYAGI
jgi:DMSO/TMAO reductase YedYZ molybdopterin-dependent catalytic subunit